ncbi:MAG TPA: tetratricopeptide repeat protein [Actinophytocola sp.]|jgi:tetratricopeptide (TPR) repeat protein/transcriptional regulator with XRE-family HTH domain|nr:tetratricopeptide repeat protein [Actinophytocola sp.]
MRTVRLANVPCLVLLITGLILLTRKGTTVTESATFGAELRRLRRQAGVSLATLAERIHYSKGYLSKIENDVVPPNAAVAALCDQQLGTDGTLVALVAGAGARRRSRRPADAALPFALPPMTSHFTGRAAETTEVLAALRDDRPGSPAVCVVSGMAGVGKTALAVRCARRLEPRFPDGCLFMDLRGHTPGTAPVDAAAALDRFLRLLGVPGDAVPADVDDRAALFRDRLRGRGVLIVLDNAQSARQVAPLLPGEPRCRVLVTSRNRLSALDDAHQVSIDVLPARDTVGLLRSLLGDRAGEADEPVLRSIAVRCGHLPLAVRVAAARLLASPSWRPADLDRRLADHAMRELADGERDVSAVFRLSLDAVPGDQRALFALLALHPGADLDVTAAAALAGTPVPDTERVLDLLRDGHLVVQDPSGRYRFHDLVRSFAVAQAAAELPDARRADAVAALLETELHATEAADRLLAPNRYRRDVPFARPPAPVRSFADHDAAVEWFRVEWPNLTALCELAQRAGHHTYCWRLAFSLRDFFFLAKLWDPWIASQRVALAAAESAADTWARATALNSLGVALIDRGDLDQAADHYDRALASFRELDDEHGVSTTLANYAWADHYRGNHSQALRNLRKALDFYAHSGTDRNVGITLRGMALVETALGRHDNAVAHATEAMSLFESLGLDLDIAMNHNCLGWAHFNAGRQAAAENSYRTALECGEGCGSAYEAARAETGLGNVAAATGRPADARHHWEHADEQRVLRDATVVGELRARRALEPSVTS